MSKEIKNLKSRKRFHEISFAGMGVIDDKPFVFLFGTPTKEKEAKSKTTKYWNCPPPKFVGNRLPFGHFTNVIRNRDVGKIGIHCHIHFI